MFGKYYNGAQEGGDDTLSTSYLQQMPINFFFSQDVLLIALLCFTCIGQESNATIKQLQTLECVYVPKRSIR